MDSIFQNHFIGDSVTRKNSLSSINPELIWVPSSGTLGYEKYVGLTKEGILRSASTVNKFFNVTSNDVFGLFVNDNFIAGLSVKARAHVAGARVVEGEKKWNPQSFLRICEEQKITITSLFPTQLYDLRNFKLPSSLRVVLVGGGGISADIISDDLHSRIYQSFSLTEASSAIGIKNIQEDCYRVLPHIEVSSDEVLLIKGISVAHAVVTFDGETSEVFQRAEHEWFKTTDVVKIHKEGGESYLKFLDRKDRIVKIKGKNISLTALEHEIRDSIEGVFALIAIPHGRDGNEVVLCLDSRTKVLSDSVMSNSYIRKKLQMSEIKLSPTGKVLLSELELRVREMADLVGE